jgi:hypothetical protein
MHTAVMSGQFLPLYLHSVFAEGTWRLYRGICRNYCAISQSVDVKAQELWHFSFMSMRVVITCWVISDMALRTAQNLEKQALERSKHRKKM